MASLNVWRGIGNLGSDPEIRAMTNGNKVANFSVACSESWRDKSSGERKERTEWVRIVVWSEGLVKVIEQYLKKGSKVYLEGQLQTRKWQDKDGRDQYTTEVVLQGFDAKLIMLDGKSDGGGASRSDVPAQRPQAARSEPDDSIPF